MIVEDDSDLAILLSLYIERRGFITIRLPTLRKMVDKLSVIEPGIIFLDNQLADGLGINFIKHIKQLYPHTVVVLMTSDDIRDVKGCEDFDCLDGFLAKPFKVDSLNEYLEQVAA
jgi:DNA-binding NtrC family response regulator